MNQNKPLINLILKNLKSHIGDSENEVIKHLVQLDIPKSFIFQERCDITNDECVIVHSSFNCRPEFMATFRNNICTSQSISLTNNELSTSITSLKNHGLVYDSTFKRWTKFDESVAWRIDEYHNGNYALTTRRLRKNKELKTAQLCTVYERG